MICGLKVNAINSEDQSSLKSNQLKDELADHLKKNLDIQIGVNEIIYAYTIKRNVNESNPPPIIISFANYAIKQEILRKAKENKKTSGIYTRIYYNERLTKLNSEILFKSRLLHRNNKIHACWSYRGEVYLRKNSTSKPTKITKLSDLETYN